MALRNILRLSTKDKFAINFSDYMLDKLYRNKPIDEHEEGKLRGRLMGPPKIPYELADEDQVERNPDWYDNGEDIWYNWGKGTGDDVDRFHGFPSLSAGHPMEHDFAGSQNHIERKRIMDELKDYVSPSPEEDNREASFVGTVRLSTNLSSNVIAKKVAKVMKENYPQLDENWAYAYNWRESRVPIESIKGRRRPGGRNMKKVREIAKQIKSDKDMPPIIVVEEGDGRELVDGFHRWLGHVYADCKTILCYIGEPAWQDLYRPGGNGYEQERKASSIMSLSAKDPFYKKDDDPEYGLKSRLRNRVGPKADRVSLKKDDKGYYIHTHRARSKSYKSVDDIPKSVVEFIESTG